MNRGTDLDQQKVVQLDRGLFFVSYKSAEDMTAPPRVMVAPAPGHERRIELVLHPDADEAVLWQPNSSLVVRVEAPATLLVQVLPMRHGGSRAAAVRIEPISPGSPPTLTRSAMAYAPAAAAPAPALTQDVGPGLRVLAHVAGIGDVMVGQNGWIAGPTAPSRVEGIMLDWPDMPPGVDIRYAVQSANAPANSKMVPLGTFAGTRGRALPITGIVLEMHGANDLQFVAEAVFLSAPTLRAIGRRVVLSGPTGREPLVGLRINVEGAQPADEPIPVQPEPTKASRKETSSGRVRVFRSRPRQDVPAAGSAR
ncbi:conserved hypothetical protein [Bradyrhizobium sp. ORS 375]|uniref:hypothetical protein n=1 Tax=Bradyrhizobium sp. (strain ORS 375) TaxID=566679 RepID=UPI000240ACF1|nr:hypothetical protein [Bradyrhizobium sp. ORS 375]CCD91749.1 conserved hypothetical protein [Bradyrhizobium sp. ORS 375]